MHTTTALRRLHGARHIALLAAMASLLFVFGGCRQLDRMMGNSGAPCTTTDECAVGLQCLTEAEGFPNGYCTTTTCVDGGCPGFYAQCTMLDAANNVTACLEQCVGDGDCRHTEGYICADLDGERGCLPGSMATGSAGAIGASCAADTDCNAGLNCLTNFVFGYCSQACTSDANCGSDALCIDQGGGVSRCMDSCQNNEQCRFGYACTDHGTGGVCDADQSSSAERNPAGAEDGQPCTLDIQCKGGTCIIGDDFPQGYCTTRDCDVVGCASSDSTCVNLQRDALCFENCAGSTDCREGYRCTSLESGGDVCYALPPITAPDADDTGAIASHCDLETVSGNTRRARFTLGANAEGFAVVPFSPSQSEVAPTRMTLPDGSSFDFESEYSFQTINSLLLATIVPMSFPAAPQFQHLVQPGEYVFEFETDDANACYFVVEQESLGTQIDLNFYLVGVPGVTAGTAEGNNNFQALLNEFRGIYSGAGISVGEVRYFDISGTDLETYRIIRDFGSIYRLIALSSSPGPSREEALSVNVFLIQDFNISELPGLLGLSAGIPGVPGVHGNGGAGLVFTSANLSADPTDLGQTMAHEVGHFLGLRHTSERGGSEYDPLNDTSTCASPEDPYGCPDVNNLMFPFSVDVEQRDITNDQIFVLQRNPLVK